MTRFLFVCALLLAQISSAQNFLSWQFKDRYFSASIGTGTSTYFGELNFKNTINDRLSQLNAGIEARLLSRVGARIEANYFTLKGSDGGAPDSSFQQQRNLSFKSRNFQIQLHGIYYLKRYRGDYHSRWAVDPYLFSGVGYMFYNPRASLGGEFLPLRDAQTEGVAYKKWALTIPAGAGIKFKINEFSSLSAEISYHYTFTDYLDDVSNTFATESPNSTAELLSNRKEEIGIINQEFYDQLVPGSPRGDPTKDDSFLLISLKVELFIPPEIFSGNKSPVIKKPSY